MPHARQVPCARARAEVCLCLMSWTQLLLAEELLADDTVGSFCLYHTAGDTVHSVLTSSGDPYQNFQTRIMVCHVPLPLRCQI